MEKAKKDELDSTRKALSNRIDEVVNATGYLLEPLKKLNKPQMDAVITLGLMIQSVILAKRPAVNLSKDIIDRFAAEVDSICPPLGKEMISQDPCFEASVAYALALKECEDKGLREEQCPDAWGPGARAVYCTMEKIDNMRRDIENLLRRQHPPRPIPWPTE